MAQECRKTVWGSGMEAWQCTKNVSRRKIIMRLGNMRKKPGRCHRFCLFYQSRGDSKVVQLGKHLSAQGDEDAGRYPAPALMWSHCPQGLGMGGLGLRGGGCVGGRRWA